jgi:hypothetical protein
MEGTPKPDEMDPAPFLGGPSPAANGGAEGPSPEESRVALDEVLQSGAFLRAEQKRSFLRYICEMELSGRGAELSEYVIGVEALGRPPGYSTGEDSSVRRHAHDLRQRLDEVYATELSSTRVRIELPKGRYAPRFVYWDGRGPAAPATQEIAEGDPSPTPAVEPASRELPRRTGRATFGLGVAVGAIATGALAVLWWSLAPGRPAVAPTPTHSVEFESHSTTLTGYAARGECRGCSNGGRVRWVGKGNDVTVNGITVGEDGNYTMQIDYVLDGTRALSFSVNGGSEVGLSLKGKSWTTPSTAFINVALRAGSNSVRFFNEQAYGPDLDRIVIR